ncbi:MAG: glycosyltransferase [Desulfobacterales bacterium]|jgi:hyaluronan synthase|nr:glycosyltransferase [Desulfobacterales bacterium]
MAAYRFKADSYYPWVLGVVSVSAVAVTLWQVDVLTEVFDESFPRRFAFMNPLAMSLAFMGLAVLAFRIWFALLYRPYAPMADDVLPSITVVIPAYNEGSQVLYTVRSVMASSYPHKKMQVICVDDGSQDDTWRWMLQAKKEFDRRVQLIRQPVNRGKRQALLAGFKLAEGQVYVTIDSDSEVFPDTLRHLVSPMACDKRVGAVAGNVRVLNIDEGVIPKMMEVSFTSAFDFLRRGQSVYGGVFCTPGALSAYRARVLTPHLTDWANQTFMGGHATIGEDRALTNLVLGCGFRVVYQRDAVVLTKMPVSFGGLRRMLLRWARSNVRENLVILSFLLKRFRTEHGGSGWIRLFTATQLLRMTIGEAFKLALVVQLVLFPMVTLTASLIGCAVASVLPAVVHQLRYGGWFGWKWAVPYSFFWFFGLSWISIWGLFTAARSGWLTRGLPEAGKAPGLTTLFPPASTR